MKQQISETREVMDMPSSLNAVDMLKADHRKVEKMFEEFESVRTKRERAKLINSIVKELTVHAKLEEKLVYPLLESEGDKTMEAYEEHHVVKMVLAELSKFDGGEENAKAKVKVLSEMVKHHVKEEEGELLPKLERSGTDLNALAEKMTQQKQKLENGRGKVTKISSKRRAAKRSPGTRKAANGRKQPAGRATTRGGKRKAS